MDQTHGDCAIRLLWNAQKRIDFSKQFALPEAKKGEVFHRIVLC
jgi:hypothetical protein